MIRYEEEPQHAMLLFKIHNLYVIMRKLIRQTQLKDIQQNCWPVSSKVSRKRESGKTKELFQTEGD